MTEKNQTSWKIDAGHSEIQFKVKHLAIANVSGTFKQFKGEALSEAEDFDGAKVNCIIDAASLDTNNAQRDGHLRSDIFFDVAKYPEIVFSGKLKKDKDAYELAGELSIHGHTHHVAMNAEHMGIGQGRMGDTRAGFELSGKINRKDYGLSLDMLTEAGGIVIGEEVKLHFDIELIRQ
jgi:polyisoprenoid-binding protein YceI